MSFGPPGGQLQFGIADAPLSTIGNFAAGDTIDVTDLQATANLGTFNAGTLSVPYSGGTLALTLAGSYAGEDILLTPDGSGGTDITLGIPITVDSAADLASAIATVNAASAGNFTLDFAANLTLSGQLASLDLHAGVSVTIEGQGNTLNGAGTSPGFAVAAGTVTIADLTIADAAAIGGEGLNGGGGGAGLGGGLFVGQGADVTLQDVAFSGDAATGGSGLGGAFGNGGGLNGRGGGGLGAFNDLGPARGGDGSFGGGGGNAY